MLCYDIVEFGLIYIYTYVWKYLRIKINMQNVCINTYKSNKNNYKFHTYQKYSYIGFNLKDWEKIKWSTELN